jgi:peptidoglycan lytic transglycosylase B
MFRSLFVFSLMIYILTAGRLAYADLHFAQRPDVQAFINYMVKVHHFNRKDLMDIFSNVKMRQQVIRHMNKPLERNPWRTYQMLFVNEWRIQHGVKFWNKYAAALKRAEQIYGVPASIIVATIGIETKYGQKTGEYRVIDSLSNLAFNYSSRSAFFRKELVEFLLLTREQRLNPFKVMGSYAGAIGQPQFMPSSYRAYAVNFSGSGKIDLMNNEMDVIGSIANYYNKSGWMYGQPIAMQAMILGDRYSYLSQKNKIKQPLTAADLAKYGIVPKYQIYTSNLKIKVIELQTNYRKEYWLGFNNFDVIKKYNPNNLYAMAVFQLSSYIAALKDR